METPQENPVEGAIVTRYHDPLAANQMTPEEISDLEKEYEDYDWTQDDEWYTAKDFLTMAEEGMIWPDCGGIVHIYNNDAPTNLHAGIWMLNTKEPEQQSVTLQELVENYDNAQILWANK